MKDYWVLVGSFGSGKSELALNLALDFATRGACTLVDLDVVNPYFRTSERGDVLEKAGVELISPPYALHKIEIMSLSPRVYAAFTPGEGKVIFDVGGDHIGAVALGQYKPNFELIPPEHLKVLQIVNPLRPMAAELDGALSVMEKIEGVSRLKINGLVNNANLAEETDVSHLLQGYELVKAMSEKTGVPVLYTCAVPEIMEEFRQVIAEKQLDARYLGRLLPIEVMMHRSWDKFLENGL
ncbi:MAG: hypothetical protein II882_05625 [Lachnospiraceae bacterium]|nr:hypothetical protein [Lachnospiraceae bacterium]